MAGHLLRGKRVSMDLMTPRVSSRLHIHIMCAIRAIGMCTSEMPRRPNSGYFPSLQGISMAGTIDFAKLPEWLTPLARERLRLYDEGKINEALDLLSDDWPIIVIEGLEVRKHVKVRGRL
jgi:hypothetical protein